MAISSDVKLRVYNKALMHLGSRQLASITENREPRRVLDAVWGSSNEAVEYALKRAGWNFAMRAIQIVPEESLESEFGWQFAFQKPEGYVRLEALATDPRFQDTLDSRSYADEAGYWLSDNEVLYAKYVSKDTDYGFDSSLWTEDFIEYLAAYMAYHSCERITQSTDKRDFIGGEMVRALRFAKSGDAMEEGTKFPQHGSWVTSRRGGGSRGSMDRLIDE